MWSKQYKLQVRHKRKEPTTNELGKSPFWSTSRSPCYFEAPMLFGLRWLDIVLWWGRIERFHIHEEAERARRLHSQEELHIDRGPRSHRCPERDHSCTQGAVVTATVRLRW